ncbi:hypothetical protein D9M73_284800 [compost metagenome]
MHLLGGRVQADPGMLDQHLGAPYAAPQQGAQARLELVEVERLDQVIIGAGIQAGNAIIKGIPRGEDQHRQAVAAGA